MKSWLTCENRGSVAEQNAALNYPMHQQLERKAEQSSGLLSQVTPDMFLTAEPSSSTAAPPPPLDELPPAYEEFASDTAFPSAPSSTIPSDETPPYAPLDRCKGKGKDTGGFFANSFKAMFSGLGGKADPLVTALCEATKRGDTRQMMGFISQDVDVNGKSHDGETPIQCAIEWGQTEALRLLISAGIKLNRASPKMPPLHYAASIGNIEAAKVLFDEGANLNEASMSGQDYFVDVAKKGQLAGIKFFLDRGASASSRDISGTYIIVDAVSKNKFDLVKMLVEYGADINAKDICGQKLLVNVLHSKNPSMVDYFLEHGADPSTKDVAGTPVLVEAVSKKDVALAKKLLEKGANPDCKDISGVKVLMRVLRDGFPARDKLDLVRLLLENGASPRAKDVSGMTTAVAQVMMDGSPAEIVDLLLQHGEDANGKLPDKEFLLIHAVRRGRMDLVEVLLRNGANPNVQSPVNKDTPLLIGMMKMDKDLLSLLLRYGADVNLAGKERLSNMAQASKRTDIIELFPASFQANRPGCCTKS